MTDMALLRDEEDLNEILKAIVLMEFVVGKTKL